MPTRTEIDQEIELLNNKWNTTASRNGTFGNALKSISVENVRGLTAKVELSWPVIAIAGANGSGKTTLLQLFSAAYVKANADSSASGQRHYKLGDWFRRALPNETPAFGDNSSVSYTFWNDEPTVNIPYKETRRRWVYPRKKKENKNSPREINFFGINFLTPRVEKKDRLHLFQQKITISQSTNFSPDIVNWVAKILDTTYHSGTVNEVRMEGKESWKDEVAQITRHGCVLRKPIWEQESKKSFT